MAVTPSNFSNSRQLSSAAPVVVVESPVAGTYRTISKLSFRNTGASRRVVTVSVVGSGGSSTSTTELAKQGIPAGADWNCVVASGEVIESGMTVTAVPDAGSDVNVNCSGMVVS